MKLRDPNPDDLDLLLAWRNDPLTRENSRNTAEVTIDDHRRWFQLVLLDWSVQLEIAEVGGVPVATVRANFVSDDLWELSWTVAPDQRGRGYGKGAVQLFISHFRPGTQFRAAVKVGNRASQRIAA